MASGSLIEHTIFRSLHPVLGLDLLLSSKCYRWAMARQWERVGADSRQPTSAYSQPRHPSRRDAISFASLSQKFTYVSLSPSPVSEALTFPQRKVFLETLQFHTLTRYKSPTKLLLLPSGRLWQPHHASSYWMPPPLPWLLFSVCLDESAGHPTAYSMIYWQDVVMSWSFATIYRQR